MSEAHELLILMRDDAAANGDFQAASELDAEIKRAVGECLQVRQSQQLSGERM